MLPGTQTPPPLWKAGGAAVLVQQVLLALPPSQHVQLTGLLVEMVQPCNQLQWQDKYSLVEDLWVGRGGGGGGVDSTGGKLISWSKLVSQNILWLGPVCVCKAFPL